MSLVLNSNALLGDIPQTLKDELIDTYNNIVINFRENRWEPSELNGGKFCEVVFSILKGYTVGSFPANSSKPRNMVDACRLLEQAGSSFPRSIRIQIPRMLIALYEIRNNRGVGHVGGDVNPNEMDAYCVLRMSKWILSELIRVFHQVDTNVAEEAVESITERSIQVVWEINGKKRILNTSLTMKEKTLLLLYHSNGEVNEEDLIDWIEYSNPSVFRKNILAKCHKEKLIEYDQEDKKVEISPTGIKMVEEDIL